MTERDETHALEYRIEGVQNHYPYPQDEPDEPEKETCHYCGNESESINLHTLTFEDHITTIPVCDECVEDLLDIENDLKSIELFKF
jgi:CRISPR/Cas system-associated protein Cas10 (large subunit of type III CRISPR-Cas system)